MIVKPMKQSPILYVVAESHSLPEHPLLDYHLESMLGNLVRGVEFRTVPLTSPSLEKQLAQIFMEKDLTTKKESLLYVGIGKPLPKENENLLVFDGFAHAARNSVPALYLNSYDEPAICRFVQNNQPKS